MNIAIVKYGMGNVASVQKALQKMGYQSEITDDPKAFESSDLIILPGVGSFKKGMENLHEADLVSVLIHQVIHLKKPFIGICLGMQLLATHGNEPEKTPGLNWIEGEVVKFDIQNGYRVPHMGWNTVTTENEHAVFTKFEGRDFYFIHSYYFEPVHQRDVAMTVEYGQKIVAALQKENIYAMQFHPEKSQEAGIGLLRSIIEIYA